MGLLSGGSRPAKRDDPPPTSACGKRPLVPEPLLRTDDAELRERAKTTLLRAGLRLRKAPSERFSVHADAASSGAFVWLKSLQDADGKLRGDAKDTLALGDHLDEKEARDMAESIRAAHPPDGWSGHAFQGLQLELFTNLDAVRTLSEFVDPRPTPVTGVAYIFCRAPCLRSPCRDVSVAIGGTVWDTKKPREATKTTRKQHYGRRRERPGQRHYLGIAADQSTRRDQTPGPRPEAHLRVALHRAPRPSEGNAHAEARARRLRKQELARK
ncbi:MAG: hypothetical protein M3285_08420 [Actinomycetota bacterium]|nr:hypothetical protein [Actinomycetota bacterium]